MCIRAVSVLLDARSSRAKVRERGLVCPPIYNVTLFTTRIRTTESEHKACLVPHLIHEKSFIFDHLPQPSGALTFQQKNRLQVNRGIVTSQILLRYFRSEKKKDTTFADAKRVRYGCPETYRLRTRSTYRQSHFFRENATRARSRNGKRRTRQKAERLSNRGRSGRIVANPRGTPRFHAPFERRRPVSSRRSRKKSREMRKSEGLKGDPSRGDRSLSEAESASDDGRRGEPFSPFSLLASAIIVRRITP